MRVCKIINCTEKHHGLGYCKKHYRRYKIYGDPKNHEWKKENEKHGLENTPEYMIWAAIKTRCYNKKNKRYKYYGGRGIGVCDHWRDSFLAFYTDMGKRPFPKAQIDRIDNNGNYEPDNCRWATATENSRNRSNTKLTIAKATRIRLMFHKPNISQIKLARIYNVSQTVIHDVVNNKIWRNI